jgi:hypothetical protein
MPDGPSGMKFLSVLDFFSSFFFFFFSVLFLEVSVLHFSRIEKVVAGSEEAIVSQKKRSRRNRKEETEGISKENGYYEVLMSSLTGD